MQMLARILGSMTHQMRRYAAAYTFRGASKRPADVRRTFSLPTSRTGRQYRNTDVVPLKCPQSVLDP